MHEHNARDYKHATVADWFTESFIGTIAYRLHPRVHYPEEDPNWEVPEKYLRTKGKPADSWKSEKPDRQNSRNSTASSDTVVGDEQPAEGATKNEKKGKQQSGEEGQAQEQEQDQDQEAGSGNDQSEEEEDPNLVTWYGPNDPANPQDWSVFKKCAVTAQLCLLTFSIYIGSAIYSPGYESLNQSFGVSSVVATLGLTLFVFGYGIGPLFLSPLSEIPAIGRNPPYVITLLIFVVLQAISANVTNFAGLMVLRFLAGFIGSPVLATGGASLGDLFSPKTRPYAIGIWGLAAIQGPVLGPLLGGFAIQSQNTMINESWRWAFYILLWLDGFCLLVLAFCFPETSSENILLRRAKRLRKRTGNENLRSQGEIDSSKMTAKDIVKQTMWMPLYLSISEPICFSLNLYIGLVYSILYVWIESFQLVFVQIYGFNLGLNGCAYLGLVVGGVIAYIGFAYYNHRVTIPELRKNKGQIQPERRLIVAMIGGILLPLCIFPFGASSTPRAHWIAPVIFSSLFGAGAFLIFQGVLNYLGDAYASKQASVLAGNDFFRSMMGGAFPLFAPALFNNLGGPRDFPVLYGCILLGGLTTVFVPLPFLLYRYGKKLRKSSKNASHI